MQINFPADIGDTVYYYDQETKLIFPMVVLDIHKNRSNGFRFMLASTDYDWDNRFAVTVTLEDYNNTWFMTQLDAEKKYYEEVAINSFCEAIATIDKCFGKIKYTDCYLTSGTKVYLKSYDYYAQQFTLVDDNNNLYRISLTDIPKQIIFK